MFKTAEELQEKIDQYFKEEVGMEIRNDEKNKKPVIIQKPPTVSGLALYLGFANRASIYDYEKNGKFTHTVKRAIGRVEEYAEKGLLSGTGGCGAIFWLKNHGWKDVNTIDGKVETEDRGISVLNELLAGIVGERKEGDGKRPRKK